MHGIKLTMTNNRLGQAESWQAGKAHQASSWLAEGLDPPAANAITEDDVDRHAYAYVRVPPNVRVITESSLAACFECSQSVSTIFPLLNKEQIRCSGSDLAWNAICTVAIWKLK